MLGNDYPFLVHEPHSPENWIRLLEQLTAMPAAERKAAAAALRSAIELVYNRDHSLAIMKTSCNNRVDHGFRNCTQL